MAIRDHLKLTDIAIRRAKHTGENKTTVLADGDGLRLLVYPNGSKVWQFRTKKGGRETTIQLGNYPAVSLAMARTEAAEIREKVRQGRDPVTERLADKARKQASTAITFQAVAEELFAVKKKNLSPSYSEKFRGAVTANLFPRIGKLPIQEIDSPILLESLKHIEARGSLDMLAFVRRCAGEIFNLAKATGRFKGDNPAEALKKNIFAQHKRKHMEALEWQDVPGFLHRLDGMSGEYATIAAVKLTMLTATRPGEARGACWEEFDFDKALWAIPAMRMKGKTEHIVPLAKQSIALLKELRAVTGHSDFLFPSQLGSKATFLSDMALLKAVKRHAMDPAVTAHGLRTTFRTHAEESGLWSFEVMEAALAHKKKNSVVAAYARATHLPARAKLAQWYADELDRVKAGKPSLQLYVASAVGGA